MAPNDGPALNNLAIVSARLGDTARAMQALETAIAADRARADQYSVMLGDLHASRGELTAARQRYESAIAANPDMQVGRQRLIAAYRSSPGANPEELLDKLDEWKEDYPEIVSGGYLWVIRQTYRSQAELADRALLQWVDVLASEGSITNDILRRLPEDWSSESVNGLREYLEEPRQPPSGRNWWLADEQRRNVLAGVALALGHNWEVTGGAPGWSARCWGAGLDFAPSYDSYRTGELEEAPVARLDLQTALASLYFKNEELDPDGSRFLDLENRLFAGKGEAYRFQDWEAVQAHHMTLGEIYAERGWWETSDRPFPGNRYTNAFFQLEAALRAARRRTVEFGAPYQPLGMVKLRLGDGYAVKEQKDRAHGYYLSAAEAFLDADLLADARAALAKASGLSVDQTPAIRERQGRLRRLYVFRRDAGNPESELVAAVARGENPISRAAAAWLYSDGSRFLRRQRFKLAADLAVQARDVAGTESFRSSTAFAGAFALSLDALEGAAEQSITLMGSGDLQRLRRCQQIIEEGAAMRPVPAKVKLGEPSRKAAGTVLGFSLPGPKQDSFIDLPDETLLAIRVFREVDFQRWLAWNARLEIRDGSARMVVDPSLGERAEIQRTARTISNLSVN